MFSILRDLGQLGGNAESFRFDSLWALNPGAMLDHLPSLGRESVRQKGVLLNNGGNLSMLNY